MKEEEKYTKFVEEHENLQIFIIYINIATFKQLKR